MSLRISGSERSQNEQCMGLAGEGLRAAAGAPAAAADAPRARPAPAFPPLVQNYAMSAAITPGLHAGFSYTVTDADTAAALGSGLVPVLSTPRVLALVERATVEALAGALAQGATTVGAKVELEHLLATPVGAPVEVDATLERVDGRRLEFAVRVTDAGRVAARGRVTRVLVDLERFLAGVSARQAG